MKPASRIQATIEILRRDEDIGLPLDSIVGDYMRQRRYIGAKDRADISTRVYDIARNQSKLGWWLDRLKAKDTPRYRVMAWLAIGENADLKRLKDLFDGSQYAPEKLDEKETELAKKLVGKPLFHDDMPENVLVECPPEFEDILRGIFGDGFEQEMKAMQAPATLDLRVNVFLSDREAVKDLLAKDGVETTETPYSPWGLRCAEKSYLAKTKAMNKGFIEIQDEGSQLIAYMAGVKPGMQVLDYCAGAGGKTLALAAAMQRKGRIVAMDTEEKRLEKGRRRYKKANLADIIEVRPLSDQKHRKWLRRQKGTFDVVLTDVPCSGTGTWRRNPDMKWRTYGPKLVELIALQAEIMDKVAHTVKIGGKLVYATCSLLPQENEEQIEKFLKNHPEFEVQPIEEALGLGSPYMRLTPHRHNTDGFFAAVLVRKNLAL
ncbi:MAG: RsmB/NOP family class I SAM-dependent RNA methyltransferase [Alphaproteobacteria bacterium]|nr:RsmB/NOP family class I SAM-dependent RNA methyltransferase [Alphaproteobacteria bacterium]